MAMKTPEALKKNSHEDKKGKHTIHKNSLCKHAELLNPKP